jgi:putative holliday junction resolvase
MSGLPAKSSARPVELSALPEPASRILAIDYGRKRIGLALSDELGLTAQPLAVFLRKNRQDDLKRLREICRRNSVALIVVGYPVHITGETGEMAAEAEQFARRLTKAVGVPTELLDERLTSWEARHTLSQTGTGGRSKREAVDDIAAAILLREYLDHRCERRSSSSERE